MFINLLNDAKIVKCDNGNAAGQTLVTSSTVDMQGFDSVMWIVDLGTVVGGAVMQLTAQDGLQSNGSDAANITDQAGSTVQTPSLTDVGGASSNGQIVLDVQRPQKRYVTATFGRTTQNVTVNSITAILYNALNKPVTQPATVVAQFEDLAAT